MCWIIVQQARQQSTFRPPPPSSSSSGESSSSGLMCQNGGMLNRPDEMIDFRTQSVSVHANRRDGEGV